MKALTINNLVLCILITFGSFFAGCLHDASSDRPEDDNNPGLISVTPDVLFKSGGKAAAPDSVETMVFAVLYGDMTITKSFPYSLHQGVIPGVPVNVAFNLKVEGKDRFGSTIFSGIESHPGSAGNITMPITANKVSPTPPSNLAFPFVSDTEIELQWVDNSSNEVGFIVERSLNQDSLFIPLDTTVADVKGKIYSTDITPSTIYYYRVAAFNSAGVSSYLVPKAVQTSAPLIIDNTPPKLWVRPVSNTTPYDSIDISGTVSDENGIKSFTVNGIETSISSDTSFFMRVRSLSLGVNQILVIAVDNTFPGNVTVDTTTIEYDPTAIDSEAPVITVSSPKDNDTIGTLTPRISGSIQEDGTITLFTVNDVIVSLDSTKMWSTVVTFNATGENKVYCEALDFFGNQGADTLVLFVDTTLVDITNPVISFSPLFEGKVFNTSPVSITIGVEETGSGLDSVMINATKANFTGSNNEWNAVVSLLPDTNTIWVEAFDKAGNKGKDSLKVILNRPPVFDKEPINKPIMIGLEYIDTIRATDADDNTLNYFLQSSSPDGMTINSATGEIRWTPKLVQSAVVCSAYAQDKYSKTITTWTLNVIDSTTEIIPPTGVTLLKPTIITDSTIVLSWTKSTAGDDFRAYEIYYSTTADVANEGTLVEPIYNIADTTHTFSGLTSNTLYYFIVRIRDTDASTGSNVESATTLKRIPAPVMLTTVSNVTDSSVDLAWEESTDPQFLYYDIHFSEDYALACNGNRWARIDSIDTTAITVTGLSENKAYYFCVNVGNIDTNASSNVLNGTTDNRPPEAVRLSSSTTTDSSILLHWTRSNALDFKKYEVYYRSTGIKSSGDSLLTSIEDKDVLQYTANGLSENTTYSFYVSVFDDDTSTASNLITDSTDNTVPEAVTLHKPYNVTSATVELSWTESDAADFSLYQIYSSTSSNVSNLTGTLKGEISKKSTTSYVVGGLSKNTKYYFIVYVFDNHDSAASNVMSTVTSAGCAQHFTTQFCDYRDGTVYNKDTITASGTTITQTWMTENLNYAHSNSWCMNDNPAFCDSLGRLYDWSVAVSDSSGNGQDICPPGWRLPSDEDWKILERNIGMTQEQVDSSGARGDTLGNLLKDPEFNGSNETGFSALLGGRKHTSYAAMFVLGFYWTGQEVDSTKAWARVFFQNNGNVERSAMSKTDSYSVRCIKDN
ncbi:MAG: fibronectin type III domain-containing protein [Fibrobacteria bacterium]|nr:fibronectin type III domain-containing protein [Fibrobacteria bacterium]